MSQVLLTAKDAQDNINNNNVADFFPLGRVESVLKSRSGHQHDDSTRSLETPYSPSETSPARQMGVTSFDTSKSVVWRTVPPTAQSAPSSTQHDNNNRGRVAKIEEGLDNSVGPEAKIRINKILGDVNSLSDVEKLLLYLKLPTGSGSSEDALKQLSNSSLHTSNRVQQGQAFTWIKSHLEEDQEICLPKQEVFEEYRSYCENHSLKCLSTADFGKVMKCVFPNIKPRRLGQRGQSKYCYSGLRKKLEAQAPTLPELEISSTQTEEESVPTDELFTASCHLVCEWAQKLLGKSFSDLRELAEFLLGNLYVNSKSMSAFTVIAAMQESGGGPVNKGNMSQLFTNPTGGNKHRETQLQLQRKLQEREMLKEQKKKLQQQKTEIEREHAQSRAGSSSERELGTPSILQSQFSDRELGTPSLSLGRSSTTPCDDMPSPARSSVSCSPSRTPTRADSVESRRTTSETEFVSPVAIRDTYRRRNSQGASEKERRRREKLAPQLSSPLFEAARNLLEGTKNLDRQLFTGEVDGREKPSERDVLVRKSNWERTTSELRKRMMEGTRKSIAATLPERMDTSVTTESHTTSSYSKHLLDIVPVSSSSPVFELSHSPNNNNNDPSQEKPVAAPQPTLTVPIGPSRSAFVPFPQRVVGSHSQVVGSHSQVVGSHSQVVGSHSQSSSSPSSSSSTTTTTITTLPSASSIVSPMSSTADTLPAHLQKSRGLARLLMSKPKKDVGVVENHNQSPMSHVITTTTLTTINCTNTTRPVSHSLPVSIHQAVQPSPTVPSNTHSITRSYHNVPSSIQPAIRSSPVIPISIQPSHTHPDVRISTHSSVASSVHSDLPIAIQPAIASSPITVEVNNNNQRLDQTPSSSPNVENSPGAVSPLTPRRTKTRFTPIRPKAPAPRTVSSMLRDQRGPPMAVESLSFGSKPVSEILKEKRERETLLLPVSPASGSLAPCIPMQLSPSLAIPAQLPVVQPVLARSAEIQGTPSISAANKTREVFIIMGTSPTAGTSNTAVPVKAKRSNTISIPILQKDIAMQLKQSSSSSTVPFDSQHSQKSTISDNQLSHSQLSNQCIQRAKDYQDKISEQNISRMEIEDSVCVAAESLTSKRKRKSPGSAKDPFIIHGMEFENGMKPLQADVAVASVDSGDSHSDSADENNPKRSKSCLPNLEHHDSSLSDSSEVCPDITSLESDALVDMPLSAAELATSLGSDTSSFENLNNQASMKTASVGVTSHSMKLSHKLMRQSLQLDKRIDTFLRQRSSKPTTKVSHSVTGDKGSMATGSPVNDLDVMATQYSVSNKHRSAGNRTASDTKLSKMPSASHEKARSTVHRGVVQTSNSFVVKKPLASKGGSRDHFLLKLLTGDSKSSPHPTAPTKDLPVPRNVSLQPKPQVSLRPVEEQKPPLQENPDILEDLAVVFDKFDSLPQDMEISGDSELPTDVADFITEAMEKRSTSGYLPRQNSSFVSLQMAEFQQQQGETLQSLVEPFPPSFEHSSAMSAAILSSQIPSHQSSVRQEALFTVPSVPPSGRDHRQRKNTPVQRSVSVPVLPMNSSLPSSGGTDGHEKLLESTESLISANTPHPVLQRLNSNERHGAQTPISDAGYHSFDSSPVPSTTPLPICLPQPAANSMEGNFSHSSQDLNQTRGSSQSQSPVQLPSPSTHPPTARSTPQSIASPRVSAETSPVDQVSVHNGFMPIGGSGSLQLDSTLINPIKPTVTLAAGGVFSSQIYSPKTQDTATSVQSQQSLPIVDSESLSRGGSQTSPLHSPPSYQDAIQSLQRQTPVVLAQEDSKLSHSDNSRDLIQDLDEDKQQDGAITDADQLLSAGSVFKPSISPSVFPFSYQLSLLRGKGSEPDSAPDEEGNEPKLAESNLSSPMSGSNCSEYSALAFQGSSETEQVEFQNVATLIKHYHANSRQQVESRRPSVNLPLDVLAQLQEQGQIRSLLTQESPSGSSKNKRHFDLPDARYMGSTPNVDVRHLQTERQGLGTCKTKPKPAGEPVVSAVNATPPTIDIRSLLEVKLVCSGSDQQRFEGPEDGAFLARRNVSQILGGSALGEDDLQTTLDDLKSLDTQYFNSIPVTPGVEQAIPEDIRDLRPLDLNNPDTITLDSKEESS